jgi:hypothetical protein
MGTSSNLELHGARSQQYRNMLHSQGGLGLQIFVYADFVIQVIKTVDGNRLQIQFKGACERDATYDSVDRSGQQ